MLEPTQQSTTSLTQPSLSLLAVLQKINEFLPKDFSKKSSDSLNQLKQLISQARTMLKEASSIESSKTLKKARKNLKKIKKFLSKIHKIDEKSQKLTDFKDKIQKLTEKRKKTIAKLYKSQILTKTGQVMGKLIEKLTEQTTPPAFRESFSPKTTTSKSRQSKLKLLSKSSTPQHKETL
ncbi:hypothetical protein K1X76_08560 [bacterium]|nr:hypothetical protein [bacterium]